MVHSVSFNKEKNSFVDALVIYLTNEQVKSIAQKMVVNIDRFSGNTWTEKVQQFVAYVTQQNRLTELRDLIESTWSSCYSEKYYIPG